MRLLSPQRLFNKDKGIIGEEHASLQFQEVPNVIINYNSRSKLSIALGKNKNVSTHQINLCVTDDDNENLAPSQKTLLQWHYRFGHKNCASFQTMFRSEPFTSIPSASNGIGDVPITWMKDSRVSNSITLKYVHHFQLFPINVVNVTYL